MQDTNDLYIDEEGRLQDYRPINHIASRCFVDWLDSEDRLTTVPNVVGTAALVERNPISD